MKLFLLTQNDNRGYDTYDSAVVCATDSEMARRIHPGCGFGEFGCGDWATKPENVEVTYLGEADDTVKAGVICASFNAG